MKSLLFKKANVGADAVLVMIILFFIALTGLFAVKMFNSFNDEVQSSDLLDTESKTMMGGLNTRLPGFLDGFFMFAFVLAWILAIVASFLVDVHPAFAVVGFIVVFFIVMAGAIFSNIYSDTANNDQFSVFINDFTLTRAVMDNFAVYIVVVALSISLVLFGKARFGG